MFKMCWQIFLFFEICGEGKTENRNPMLLGR